MGCATKREQGGRLQSRPRLILREAVLSWPSKSEVMECGTAANAAERRMRHSGECGTAANAADRWMRHSGEYGTVVNAAQRWMLHSGEWGTAVNTAQRWMRHSGEWGTAPNEAQVSSLYIYICIYSMAPFKWTHFLVAFSISLNIFLKWYISFIKAITKNNIY